MRALSVFPLLLLAGVVSSHAAPREITPGRAAGGGEAEAVVANGNREAAGTLRDGVLTVRLEVREGRWRPEADDGPAVRAQAFAEEGKPASIPGPLIRVRAGTVIDASVRNTLADSTLVVHGLHARPGSPDDSLVVPPGETRRVRFRAGAPGTYYYWGSTTGGTIATREWLDSQLAGALIVDPPAGASRDDRIFVLGVWFRPADSTVTPARAEQLVMTINGKAWPHTERFTFTQGDSARWRWINPTVDSHPMHLHGFYFRVESHGGAERDTVLAPAARHLANTQLIPPGGTAALSWSPTQPGNWVFHCHFAFHVSTGVSLTPDEPTPGSGGAPAHDAAMHDSATHDAAVPDAMAHPRHRMAGLVLGIHVNPDPKRLTYASAAPARAIRLVVQAAPKRFGRSPGVGFVLDSGRGLIAADSVAIPGPMLVLRRGERVAITVVNHLKEETAVHWHGLEIESFPDGVPGWSGLPGRIFPPIAPADSFVAEFTPPRAGTFIYHSHSDETGQITSGMYGAIVVVDSAHPLDTLTDRVVIVGGAGPPVDPAIGPLALVNGQLAPPPMHLRAGRSYRLRLINIQPDWRVVFALLSDTAYARWRPLAKDGADLPASQRAARPAILVTGPGETADFAFTPTTPGRMRLEVRTLLPGWYVPIEVVVEGR
ncbi:MAG TPA: multicopper oxidase domain-containing protein [Gemmatimonadaceae bacterium]|nr:multicopper oxidase domain-containing protein [Gemmatimonadaceae bacterium]